MTAHHITIAPDSKLVSLEKLSHLTHLPAIKQSIANYTALQISEVTTCMLYFTFIDVWHKF